MKKHNTIPAILALLLVLIAIYALNTISPPEPSGQCSVFSVQCSEKPDHDLPLTAYNLQQRRSSGAPPSPSIAWRVQLQHKVTAAPLPLGNKWLIADTKGSVFCFNCSDGSLLWQSNFSKLNFSGATQLPDNRVALTTESGSVMALDASTGNQLWQVDLQARFFHPALSGTLNDKPTLWLVSQSDGTIFCLSAVDGALVWQGDSTNRCDGPAALWPGHLAYGNCDGAVYIFDSSNGTQLAKVPVGDQDQMAGGILVMPDNRLATGTRSGHLAIINPTTRTCETRHKISDGEAFITPIMLTPTLLAMANDEGEVSLLETAVPGGTHFKTFDTRFHITALYALDSHLLIQSNSGISIWQPDGTKTASIELGDDLTPLTLNSTGTAALIADGALVALRFSIAKCCDN